MILADNLYTAVQHAHAEISHLSEWNMAYLCKIYPSYVINAINCTIVRFSCSGNLQTTAAHVNLEHLKHLKFAIIFTIADTHGWRNKINAHYQKIKKIRKRIFIHPCSPLFFDSPQQKFHSLS